MNTQIIDELRTVEVHDLPVARFEILFEERKAILELEEFDEVSKTYHPLRLIFGKLNNLYTDNLDTDTFQCEGIMDIDCKPVGEKSVEAKVIIDMGHSKPVFVIMIVFEELQIQRSLARN